jgi:hypothetical protein
MRRGVPKVMVNLLAEGDYLGTILFQQHHRVGRDFAPYGVQRLSQAVPLGHQGVVTDGVENSISQGPFDLRALGAVIAARIGCRT